jgi:hypothetical protein
MSNIISGVRFWLQRWSVIINLGFLVTLALILTTGSLPLKAMYWNIAFGILTLVMGLIFTRQKEIKSGKPELDPLFFIAAAIMGSNAKYPLHGISYCITCFMAFMLGFNLLCLMSDIQMANETSNHCELGEPTSYRVLRPVMRKWIKIPLIAIAFVLCSMIIALVGIALSMLFQPTL